MRRRLVINISIGKMTGMGKGPSYSVDRNVCQYWGHVPSSGSYMTMDEISKF